MQTKKTKIRHNERIKWAKYPKRKNLKCKCRVIWILRFVLTHFAQNDEWSAPNPSYWAQSAKYPKHADLKGKKYQWSKSESINFCFDSPLRHCVNLRFKCRMIWFLRSFYSLRMTTVHIIFSFFASRIALRLAMTIISRKSYTNLKFLQNLCKFAQILW